jgi:RNA polymerase sigma-70 factor (ECF subfamily)
MDLALLLERCRQGDELAWEALVRQYQARIYGITFHYTGNREDAGDLAQEVFVRIYRNLRFCTDAQGFLPWIIRIARNACIDHLRKKKTRPVSSAVPADEMTGLRAQGLDPEEQWTANARRRLVYRALRELTLLNREIILLKEILGLSLEEIASLLQVPVGTVKSRSNRARIELAQKVLDLESVFK